MKIVGGFLMFFLCATISLAQCHEQDITDSLERKILFEYQQYSLKWNFLRENMGIIILVKGTDSLNRKIWRLEIAIADDYKLKPTDTYDILGDMVVLIYQGKSKLGFLDDVAYLPPTDELITCLEGVITDRVYIRRPPQPRWVAHTLAGKFIKEKRPRDRPSRYRFNTVHVIFNKDGTYLKY